ncbi:hypothetical protein [Geminocystis sp. NIES-3709]|uniref:hypothetical protein n=1 Tax=Geminocystis sp. NIES-3709 TaxID=1617448 RepID=UPI0005FC5B76|nr:hypothetical protein [Geminocystis sp. NIES-3709]BAQ64567.1 hypothetical protein GM3709_1332 [Geminocystis sp. NIES-3709]
MKPIDRSFKQKLLTFLLKQNSSQQQGYVLVLAIGVVVGLAGLVALYAKTSRVEQYNTSATVDSNSGFYGAEAGLNLRANLLREAYLNYEQPEGTSPTSSTACFDSNTSNDGTGDFQCDKFEVGAADTKRSPGSVTTYVVAKNNGDATVGIVPRGNAFQGLTMLEYGHSIYSLGFKDNNAATQNGKQAVAILQMDVLSRLIPMFQFAAFYTGDLEIFPGADMTLNGPVHTNGDLYLGSNATLNIKGQVTTVQDIFNFKPADNSKFADGKVKIANALGTLLNLLSNGTGSTTQTTNAMDPTRIKTAWGTQVQVQTDAPVSIPTPSILNTTGDYYTKGDIRIKFKPQATAPNGQMNYLKQMSFEVSVVDRTNSSGQPITSPVARTFNANQLDSLRQPVMVGADIASIPSNSPYHACTPATLSGSILTWWNGLTTVQKNTFREVTQEYIQEQIQSQTAPLLYSLLSIPIEDVKPYDTNLYGSFAQNTANLKNNNKLQTAFTTATSRNNAVSNLDNMTTQQIAGLAEYTGTGSGTAVANTARCFVAAPLIDVGRDDATHLSPFRFRNAREARDMRLLQLNIESLAIWNRDGVYLKNGNTLDSTEELLYLHAPVDNNAPQYSFQRLGLAAIDNSQEGMVLHATIDGDTYTNAKTKTSRYGFVLVRGKQVFGLAKTTSQLDPTGLTVASDQAVYVQGDYNTANKQPASVLADSFNAISNACLNNDRTVNHLGALGCNINGSTTVATNTNVNAAVLAGTDITNGSDYNGGLENYPRFMENWSGKTWAYRGSFVSISTPLYVSGKWPGTGTVYNAPNRDWDYDVEFNDPKNLPPLTPQFVALKQESFIRSFEQ